ncbi:hypothetical protein L484_018196 [Morus notabilis]|uniref:Secreted protein n=1 Tax=Morus notabilis TaxID=981085 RepID=W9RHV2_9ROSA|nr:hypothetical protein L484_018196 [Morus notabilis]
MSKSDPKLQVLALFLAHWPLLALEFFPTGRPVRSTGHPSIGRPIRLTGHLSTGLSVELHSSVTGQPVPTETDPKQPRKPCFDPETRCGIDLTSFENSK